MRQILQIGLKVIKSIYIIIITMNIAIKEKIARKLGEFFTTDQIVNVFKDANIPTDKTLFAKWRIILDAFSKIPDQGVGISKIIEVFCHPLNFNDNKTRENFVNDLNQILTFAHLAVFLQENDSVVVSTSDESLDKKYKSPTDYILEALNFFKNEYNKVKLPNLTYEYFLGELEAAPDEHESEEYQNRLKAVKRLKDANFITEYELGVENTENGIYGMAICKIDENKIIDTNQAPATETKVKELVHKIEITAMPEIKIKRDKPTAKYLHKINPELISDNVKPEITIGKLVSYSDGSIRYNGQNLDIRNQLKDLCRLFMNRPNLLTETDMIRNEIINAPKRKNTSFKTISKYVSELHSILQNYFKIPVIFNQKEEGWYFRPPN